MNERGVSATIRSWAYREPQKGISTTITLWGIFIGWLFVIINASIQHVPWRDEVRAYTIAITSADLGALWQTLHQEGHPLLWYLLLRGLHAIAPYPVVLKIASLIIAACTGFIVTMKSPFRIWIRCLILMSEMMIFENSVLSRSYGMSVLCMFLFAWCYKKYRRKSLVLGSVLFLLANTNIPSAILAGVFLIFWLIDLWDDKSAEPFHQTSITYIKNAALAGLGIIICFLTVYPTTNAIAPINHASYNTITGLAHSIFLPSLSFYNITPSIAIPLMTSALLFATVSGVISHRASMVALASSLILLSLFFTMIFTGQYRHQNLWIGFLISIYWIQADRSNLNTHVTNRITIKSALEIIGLIACFTILCKQAENGYNFLRLERLIPCSQSENLAVYIQNHPKLSDAIIMIEPDNLNAALPYYLKNPLYLLRERTFRGYYNQTRNSIQSISILDILKRANSLQNSTKRPVIILLGNRLERLSKVQDLVTGPASIWTLHLIPSQIDLFFKSTAFLSSFRPALMGEEFDAYLFTPNRYRELMQHKISHYKSLQARG